LFDWENENGGRFVAFPHGAVSTPLSGVSIPNQDLGTWSNPDLIIVTPTEFLPAAERLAQFRETWDGFVVEVVTTDQVFNQFASGQPDVSAVRNMAKYVHDAYSNFRYLLVFGRGSYDYKHLETEYENQNWVPVYQARNSLDPLATYSSDDYLGFLDDEEGEWEENLTGNHGLDIGVGRLPVISLEEAEVMVDKLIHYSQNPRTLGDWRQRILFLADDEDNNTHQRDAERISQYVDTSESRFFVRKLYLDAFPQTQKGSFEDSPEARLALNESIFRGALMVNYTGHGNELAWAEEGFFREDLIEKWKNLDQLPLFITATCEFGRHDSPRRRSAAEKILLSDQGGAIALLTTSRPVFSNSNFLVNRVFFEQAFYPLDNGESPRLGDIIMRTKNRSLNGVNNRNFILLGDPSMRLAYPNYEIGITQVNGRSVDGEADTIQALGEVALTGIIRDGQGGRVSAFNGTLTAALYDNASVKQTLGNPPNNTPMPYAVRDNLLFRGQATVTDGQFSLTFVLPRNIDYKEGLGRMHLYASDPDQHVDAQGVSGGLIVSGSQVTNLDFSPPSLRLFMNDTTFQPGGATQPDPVLVVLTEDENGINLSQSQVGQTLRGQVDGGKEFSLSEFYTALPDEFGKGLIEYPLFDLEEGLHTVRVQAFDVYNNGATSELPFIVTTRGEIALEQVLNYPNPFTTSTTFRFAHNRAGDPLSINVQIYSAQGQLVRAIEWEVAEGTSLVDGLVWDGNDDQGLPLQSGLYLYKIFVKSEIDQVYTEATNRLVVIK
ncbi:MAG: type IX secretion system sortase PorU, partial [Bacteroidota bacterium]